jgi:hypothetical protein
MPDWLAQVGHELIGRWEGPFAFRFIIQPVMAALLALRAGLRDARAGRPPFGWSAITDPDHRAALLKDWWKDVAKLFGVAIVVDLIYGFIVFHAVRPVQPLIIAMAVALPPYLLVRGPTNRIARLIKGRGKGGGTGPGGKERAAPASITRS